jgi:hypothetical protein
MGRPNDLADIAGAGSRNAMTSVRIARRALSQPLLNRSGARFHWASEQRLSPGELAAEVFEKRLTTC